jgi:hypothetical protein
MIMKTDALSEASSVFGLKVGAEETAGKLKKVKIVPVL